MNQLSVARAVAIACALWAIPGCYASHGLGSVDGLIDGSPIDGSLDGRARDGGSLDGDTIDADPMRDSGMDSALDAGIVDPPPPGVRAVQLAAGRDHMCALGDDGAVYCWGDNEVGQSAAGERRRQLAPSRVSGLPPIASVHTMDLHTCAVGRDGSLWCWGFSYYGQLGVPDSEIAECGRGAECSRVPLQASVSRTERAFMAHHGTCSRDVTGGIRCWGDDIALREMPVDELRAAQTVDFGIQHGCALSDEGVIRCFGESEFGRIGERDDGLIDLDNVTALEVGTDHSCVLTEADQVLCWGYDWSGALGVPKVELPNCHHGDRGGECSATPIPPSYLPPTRTLSVGAHRTCVITIAGGVGCWGAWTVAGGTSWCGADEDECDSFFTEVEGTGDAVAIEAGASVACIIDSAGAVHCWGWGERGQLGNGRVSEGLTAVPVRVLGFGE